MGSGVGVGRARIQLCSATGMEAILQAERTGTNSGRGFSGTKILGGDPGAH